LKEAEVIKYIKASVSAEAQVNADDIAKAAFGKAVTFVGRLPNVDYNRDWVTFNFTASKGSYKLGVDIMAQESDIMNAQELHSTDNIQPIILMSLPEYRNTTGGFTGSGRPTHATIHSASKTLEVYPTPDSSYEYGLYVQKSVTSFKDIPVAYHDVVCDIGVLNVRALRDPQVAMQLAQQGLEAIKYDAILGWSGDTIRADRALDRGGRSKADSQNLRNY